jgi:hypothetical protein
VSLAIFILGGKAISNEFLRMIGVNETVFLAMIMCGGFLIVTASVGVSAAYSKNECLAFIVRMVFNSHFLVRIPWNVHHACLYSSLHRPFNYEA